MASAATGASGDVRWTRAGSSARTSSRRALHEPRLLRSRDGAPLAARLADRVPRGPAARAGDYVEHRIGTSRSWSCARPAGGCAPRERLPPPGPRLAAGCGRFEGGASAAPSTAGPGPSTASAATSSWRGVRKGAPPPRGPAPRRVPRRSLGRLRVGEPRPGGAGAARRDRPGGALPRPGRVDRMGVLWHKVVELPVNWKAALDAFLESYHVPNVHPEYPELGTDIRLFAYSAEPGGHSHYGFRSPPARRRRTRGCGRA